MPNYPWLFKKPIKVSQLPRKIDVMRMLGVPYPIDLSEEDIRNQIDEQAAGIVARLADKGAFTEPDKEIVALIAYLQKLGTYELSSEKEAREAAE